MDGADESRARSRTPVSSHSRFQPVMSALAFSKAKIAISVFPRIHVPRLAIWVPVPGRETMWRFYHALQWVVGDGHVSDSRWQQRHQLPDFHLYVHNIHLHLQGAGTATFTV
jgi:hypothetical protein